MKRIAELEKENFDLKIRLAMNSNYDANSEEQNLVEQVLHNNAVHGAEGFGREACHGNGRS
jgi:uncharacterized membrane protein affecting hemolysin expression